MSGGGFGLLGNIIVGVIGALIGGWVFSLAWHRRLWTDRIDYRCGHRRDHSPRPSQTDQTRLAPGIARSGVGGRPGCGMIPRRRTPGHFPKNRPRRLSTKKSAAYMRFTQNIHNSMMSIPL
jgi:hypothetical protein